LTRDYRKKSVLVVCHSVVVLIFRRLLERWNEDEYIKIDREQDVLNCSVTAYRFDSKMGKLTLDFYNKVSHSDGLRKAPHLRARKREEEAEVQREEDLGSAAISLAESGRPEAVVAGSPPDTQAPSRQVSTTALPSEPAKTLTTSPSSPTDGPPITEPTFIAPSTMRILHKQNSVRRSPRSQGGGATLDSAKEMRLWVCVGRG